MEISNINNTIYEYNDDDDNMENISDEDIKDDDINTELEEKIFNITCKNHNILQTYCKQNLLHLLNGSDDLQKLFDLELMNSRLK